MCSLKGLMCTRMPVTSFSFPYFPMLCSHVMYGRHGASVCVQTIDVRLSITSALLVQCSVVQCRVCLWLGTFLSKTALCIQMKPCNSVCIIMLCFVSFSFNSLFKSDSQNSIRRDVFKFLQRSIHASARAVVQWNSLISLPPRKHP